MNSKRPYILVILIPFLLFAGYKGWSHYMTEQEAQQRADYKFEFNLEPEHVREIGYIQDLRITRDLNERRKKILWWVKVPSTNKTYSCSWEAGFPEYKKGEGVVLIHIPGGTETADWYGYIIGLHGNHKGKQTLVWALDVDDLDLD